MAHKHSVYDTDRHFVIDPITRKITTECKKTQLMQKDHNSERFTFEIPRNIEGHDMSLCNVVQIHYINTNSSNKDYQVQDIYEVNDLQLSPDSEDIVILSWLISSNATTYNGTLNFVIRFACVDEETKAIDYQWFTDIYSAITVAKTIYNVDVVTDGESSDILENWKEEISKAVYESTLELVQEAKKSAGDAAKSETNAGEFAKNAASSSESSKKSAETATSQASLASESRIAAESSAETATSQASLASESRIAAESSASSASKSAVESGKSAEEASVSAANAKKSEENAKKSEQAASDSASAASQSEKNAGESATNAASSAQSASDSERAAIESSNSAQQSAGTASEKAAEASESSQSASTSASSAGNSATAASASAILAESYTHGRTGTREGEDTDNAKYYMEQTKAVSIVDVATTEKAGIVKPDGTTITADADGTIHGANTYELPVATTDTLGGVKPDGTTITADSDGTIRVNADSELSATSTNPVQNKVVKKYVDDRTSSVAWNDITGKPSTYPPSSHTHTKSQITDFPSSLPANGGNSSTVNGHTVNSDVPSGAKFTDTTYNDATTSAHGLMTPAMVSKLNGIADGANRTTIDTAMSDTSTNPVQNKVVKSNIDTLQSEIDSTKKDIDNLKKSVSDGKTTVANAITAKGVTTATDATFATMANNISQITTGVDTSDATATAGQILSGKTAYVKGSKITGSMPDNSGLNTNGSVPAISREYPTVPTRLGSNLQFNIATDGIGRISICPPEGYYQSYGGSYVNRPASDFGNATASEVLSGKKFTSSAGLAVTGTLGTRVNDFTKKTLTRLSTSRTLLAGASVGNYALFAGGKTGVSSDETTFNVDAYNTLLVRSMARQLDLQTGGMTGGNVCNYALFAGGHSTKYSAKVYAYDSSLVMTIPFELTVARGDMASASVGDYILFAGGLSTPYGPPVRWSTVDAYDSVLTHSTPTELTWSRSMLAGASVGNYALFAGGATGGLDDLPRVEAYDTSLVRTTPTELSGPRVVLAGASVGNYALFAGGIGNYGSSDAVEVYSSSLVRTTASSLTYTSSNLSGCSIGNYALFAGGRNDTICYNVVNAYNSSLVRSNPCQLSESKYDVGCASVGKYAIFAGGNLGSGASHYSGTVDAIIPPHVSISDTIWL